jgi:hypothetical protein
MEQLQKNVPLDLRFIREYLFLFPKIVNELKSLIINRSEKKIFFSYLEYHRGSCFERNSILWKCFPPSPKIDLKCL